MSMSSDSRILLIDDMPSIHEDFRKILMPTPHSRALAEAEGSLFGAVSPAPAQFLLDVAFSGEEGLSLLKTALFERRPYALAFVDMRMPAGWDGVRTIEELWREDKDLQVVICTAYSDHPLEEALTRLDSQDRLLVLKKPFDPIEVNQMTRALVAKRRSAIESAAHLSHLQQVLHEVQEAAVELRLRNIELETLARTVSQDLRSPMAAISRFSALLSQELGGHGGGKVATYLERLRVGAKSGEELVDGVLSLTDIARSDFAAEMIDLSRIAYEVVEQQRQASPKRQVSTSVQDGMRAWGDPRLVRSVLEHLLDNAWKFTAGQKLAAITVGGTRGPEGESVFFVRDSGCGFDIACAGNLFRKFQRLHPPGEFSGAGVGLVAVGRIIDKHGGRVWANSRPGEGTTVFFTLAHPAPAGPSSARA